MKLRLLTFILLTSTFSSYANDNLTSLANIYNELSYELSVEWDQKDKSFRKQVISKFEYRIQNLKNSGLALDDLIGFADSHLVNGQSISKFINENSEQLSVEQVIPLISNQINKESSQGANWLGKVAIVPAFVVLVAVIALVNADWNSEPEDSIFHDLPTDECGQPVGGIYPCYIK